MTGAVSGRVRRSVLSRFASLGAFAVLVGLLAGCDTTPVVMKGTVAATPSGSGVGGVTIAVYANDSESLVATTTTNTSGAYALHASSLADGTYRVRVGERWWPDAASWSDADTIVVSASASTTLDFTVVAAGSLSGVVVDHNGAAINGVRVVVARVSDGQGMGEASTDAGGAFAVEVAAAGSYQVLLLDPSGTWPSVLVGGATPSDFGVVTGDVAVGTIDISTGLPYAPPLGITTRVSVASDGTQSDGGSDGASISADGRYIAFYSGATNLVADDTNGASDVFVHDRSSGTTTRVSVASDGTQANSDSLYPSISADGRYIAFYSEASNLVAGDTNGLFDVFVHDRSTGATTQVSVAFDGTPPDGGSYSPSISADGRYIAFHSIAANLVAGDTNDTWDVFSHDRSTGTTTRVSVASDGTQANNQSLYPLISADGRYIAFNSEASNLVAGDTNLSEDVFVHDRYTGTTTRVSVASDGTQANNGSYGPSINADGRYIAFSSAASNLVTGDIENTADVFIRDQATGTTTRVSVASDGTPLDGGSYGPSISADGRYIAYLSNASNLVAGDPNGMTDAFVHDRSTGATTRVSVASDGTQADYDSAGPSISADGRYIAFISGASNLVAGDNNINWDVFVHELPAP